MHTTSEIKTSCPAARKPSRLTAPDRFKPSGRIGHICPRAGAALNHAFEFFIVITWPMRLEGDQSQIAQFTVKDIFLGRNVKQGWPIQTKRPVSKPSGIHGRQQIEQMLALNASVFRICELIFPSQFCCAESLRRRNVLCSIQSRHRNDPISARAGIR
jgi:hypothetical protein